MTKKDMYSVIAQKHGYPDSQLYRHLLEALMTPIEAEIGLALPKPPGEITSQELSELLDSDLDTVNKTLESLFQKGVITAKDIKSRRGLRFTRGPFYMFMTTLSALDVDPTTSRLCKAWYEFAKAEFYPDIAKMAKISNTDFGRVIPYYKAILNSPEILPHEDLREFVKESRMAVCNCSCRQCMSAGGEPCKRTNNYEVCMNFGRSAEYILERGVGEAVSSQETLKIFDECEEKGLVHVLDKDVATVCNCCSCCCFGLRTCVEYEVPFSKVVEKSRYVAKTNIDLCKGCQTCMERCQFDAIQMQEEKGSAISKAMVDVDKCFGCGACVISCPTGARTLELIRPAEFLEHWENYENWFGRIKR